MISHPPSDPSSQDVLVAEYTGLRDEINSNSLVAAQTVTIAFTAAVAFISFGLERQNWVIFFAPEMNRTQIAQFRFPDFGGPASAQIIRKPVPIPHEHQVRREHDVPDVDRRSRHAPTIPCAIA